MLKSDRQRLLELLPETDVVIGAVLVPGAAAPHLVTNQDLGLLRPGALLLDVAIDQGGCFEASRPTTHARPTYPVGHVQLYAVGNMPGAAPVTATQALTDATLPYVLSLLSALDEGELNDFHGGVNVQGGRLVHPAVAATYPDLAGADAGVGS